MLFLYILLNNNESEPYKDSPLELIHYGTIKSNFNRFLLFNFFNFH
ncbi:hypothetical protein PT2222_180102 [Paraburkholderia tropica]